MGVSAKATAVSARVMDTALRFTRLVVPSNTTDSTVRTTVLLISSTPPKLLQVLLLPAAQAVSPAALHTIAEILMIAIRSVVSQAPTSSTPSPSQMVTLA